jgi:uncharacterized damage-inducible protein DinB
MEHNLQNTIALLTRTPAALDALLRGLPETWTMHNEGKIAGKDTWTVRDVLAHLIHCERNNWIVRAKWIIDFGESRPFEPFQRDSHRIEPVEVLLDEFAALRSAALDDLRSWNLTPEHLALRGTHPAFGPVTLSQQLATWAAHDLTHLHQISRIMAHQYRESVGPWSKYLGVMHCNGHSASA